MACCAACAGRRRKPKVSGMKTKQIKNVVTTGAGVAAGLVAANMVSNLSFAQSNPILRVVLPIAGAMAVKSFMGKGGDSIALGMAAQAVTQGVRTYLPGVASSVGIGGTSFYKSTYLPGVSGGGGIVFD